MHSGTDMLTEEEVKKLVSANLRRLRTARGWSQDQLAKKAGLTTVGYGDIERGITLAKVSSLAKIAAALGCTLDEILPTKKRT